jgi:hypothetical protein
MGALRLGVADKNGKTVWLEKLAKSTTVAYGQVTRIIKWPPRDRSWTAAVRVAPAGGEMHGLVPRRVRPGRAVGVEIRRGVILGCQAIED